MLNVERFKERVMGKRRWAIGNRERRSEEKNEMLKRAMSF